MVLSSEKPRVDCADKIYYMHLPLLSSEELALLFHRHSQ